MSDTEGSIQVLIDFDPTFGKACPPRRFWDLEAALLELHAVVVANDAIMLQGKDPIKRIACVGDKGASFHALHNS